MNFDEFSQISVVNFTSNNSADNPVTNLVPSVSLSRKELLKLENLEDKDAAKIADFKLPVFWNRVGKNQFCLPDGSLINSEVTILEYYNTAYPLYSVDVQKLSTKEKAPTYTICYKETTRVPNANKAGDVPLDLTLHTFENQLGDFGTFPDASALDPNAIAMAAGGPGSRPGQMTVNDWNEVLVGNNLLKGFLVDPITQNVSRARKTAFTLEPNPVNQYNFSPGTVTSAEMKQIKDRARQSTKLSPIEKVERGLRKALPGALGKSSLNDDPEPPDADPLEHLYPLWEVCDDSNIKIETLSTKMQLASAKQGFSSMSVQAAVTASIVSLDISAGYGKDSSSASSNETGTKSDQMHATYEFPRVRLYLDEESVSLSKDCIDAIHKIQQTKSYKDLQSFYKDYGHLFVTQVKLGGRLRATRYLTASEAASMDSAQNAWKASLAASFSAVTTSGSIKATDAGGGSSEQKTTTSAVDESICWEAHGGNTALANNPSAWCTTVENSWYWRVVEQEIILPIEDVISKMEGFEETRTLFASIIIDALSNSTPMEIAWNGAEDTALGQGVSASSVAKDPTDLLRDSALTAGEVKIVDVPMERPSQWSVITNNQELYNFLDNTFQQTINSYIGTKLFPNMVFRLGVSVRAFSVVLNIRDKLQKSTTTFTVNSTQPTDPQEWRTKYGDFYINSITSGNSFTVVWTFISEAPSEELSAVKSAIAGFFSNSPASYEIGCAYMTSLATKYPCETYLYDAYYNETTLSSPMMVTSTIAKRQLDGAKQILSVGLEPYLDLDSLQEVAKSTTFAAVSPDALRIVRNDHIAFAFQSIKRRPDLTILDQTRLWAAEFSSNAYSQGEENPDGKFPAANDILNDYRDLFNRKNSETTARKTDWPRAYGDERAFERTLKWIQLSRQTEANALASQSKSKGSTTFGLHQEPTPNITDLIPGQNTNEGIIIYSLCAELVRLGLQDKLKQGLDNMWSDVADDLNIGMMWFGKLGRVIAYELTTSWDGTGSPPPVSTGGFVGSTVGDDLKTWALQRKAAKTDDWKVTDDWIVIAPFTQSEIEGQ